MSLSPLSIVSTVLGRRRPSTSASFVPPFPLRNHKRISVAPHRLAFSGVRLFQHADFPSLTLASAAKNAKFNSNLDSIAEDAIDCCNATTRRGIRFVVVAAACACACVMFAARGQRALAAAESVGVGVLGLKGQFVLPKELGPKLMQVLRVCKDQGLILAALLGLSAFFSMAETAITTLWPWKILETGAEAWILFLKT